MFFLRVLILMSSFSVAFAENQKPKIIVVGGGLAGLTTAYRLHQEGADVELYEARSRIGGRVFTVKINGATAELGGQSILDGGEAENLRRLIKEFNLKITGGPLKLNYFYFENDHLIPMRHFFKKMEWDPEALREKLDQLASQSHNMKEVLQSIFSEDDPIYKVIALQLAGYEGGSIENLSPLYCETLYHMLLEGFSSVHPAKEEEAEVDLFSIEGGNALLTEKIGETLQERLHLNSPLKKIQKDEQDSYILTFHDGRIVKGDILVLAIPCTTYEDIEFEENIIEKGRLEAIKNVKYGETSKIILPFAEPYPESKNLLSEGMYGFFNLEHTLYTLYCVGANSSFSETSLLDIYNKQKKMLEQGFELNCPSSIPPSYAEDGSFTSYCSPVGYSWVNDPYAKGSYSYIAQGQESLLTHFTEENGETFKTLFAPIEEKIFFVGEHTSILIDAAGTMEAACESGERTARTILGIKWEPTHQKEFLASSLRIPADRQHL